MLTILKNKNKLKLVFLKQISYRQQQTSSSSTMLGDLSRVLAIATRCFSPPLNFNPLSPTFVWYPSGMLTILWWMSASLADSITSSSLASTLPYLMLLLHVESVKKMFTFFVINNKNNLLR